MNNKDKLDLKQLESISGGSFKDSLQIISAIDANPNLKEEWTKAIKKAQKSKDEFFSFTAADQILKMLGIDATFYEHNVAGNQYRKGRQSLSQEQVIAIIKNYKE